MDERERALELIERSNDQLRQLLPTESDVFDVHTHVGNDIDGMSGNGPELVESMDEYGISRAFTFCLDEPDRHPAFRAANDRTLATAAASDGRLIPFVRLDLNETPLEEAVRCLDAGARGIKLHPRAQGFTATDERLRPVFELAAERRVPILIHGGRGLPPIAAGLSSLVEHNPGTVLIIAHAGIADMAGLAESLGGKRGVVFDTSTWSAVDLLDFHRRVPPEQLVYASDYPYGQQPSSLLIALKTAQLSGFSESALRGMLAGTANAIADGQELPEPTTPVGQAELRQPLQLARIHQYLSMATPLLWMRQQDTIGVLGLAINASAERDGHVEASERIHELLASARDLWASLPSIEDAATQRSSLRLAYRLIHLADIEAVTVAELLVNGHRYDVQAEVGTTLAEALRDELSLTGTKVACAEGHCGACTVLVDGRPTLSCLTLVHTADGAAVTTIEGLRDHPMVAAFVRADAVQCGFCTPGQIVSAVALVDATPAPSTEEIRHAMAGNLCRCGTYPKIEEAIRTWRD